MDIGQLFLNLGIKGSEKTVGALSDVKKGLSETASLSLEAKAGILAAMYALERLFAASGKTGTDLTNFNALTGQSVQVLQQYQYAARQVGVSNQEVEGSFKTLQGTMTKTLMGEGAPKGLARVSLLTGGITTKDIEQYAKQPQLLIQKLQEYASKETNIGLRNETLKSFGLGENMIAALSRNAFRPEVLKKAPTYSDSEIASLDKANIAWSNLGTKIEMAIGHFNALHGGQLVKEISVIVTAVVKLAGALTTLAEKLHIFEAFAKVFNVVDAGIEDINKRLSLANQDKKGLGHGLLTQGEKLIGTDIPNQIGHSSLAKSLVSSFQSEKEKLEHNSSIQSIIGFLKRSLPSGASNSGAAKTGGNSTSQNNHLTINNTFSHPGVDPTRTHHSVKHAVQQGMRQLSAQTQAT